MFNFRHIAYSATLPITSHDTHVRCGLDPLVILRQTEEQYKLKQWLKHVIILMSAILAIIIANLS